MSDLGNKEIFGKNLQRLMDQRGETVSTLADTLKFSTSTVWDWVKGKSYPRIDKIELLANHYGVSKSYLVERQTTAPTPPSHTYPYIPADIAAGPLQTVDAITSTDTITLPDVMVGKYAGRNDLKFMHVNGDSMDRLIPDGSLIGVEELDDITDLRKNDIVVFCDDDVDYSVKRFSNNSKSQSYIFSPVSNNDAYEPIVYRYEDAESLRIIGRVVLYVVNL
jgi:transcriptional regulator with XRE-family HTH domain